jgi:hypothetical protein
VGDVFKQTNDVTPIKYRIFLPFFFNLHPKEMAYAIDAIFAVIGQEGFSVVYFKAEKGGELEVRMVR